MNGFSETRMFLQRLETVAGRELVFSRGLDVMMCVLAAQKTGEDIDVASVAARTGLHSETLERYLQLMVNVGLIEVFGPPPWLQTNPPIRFSNAALAELA